MIRIFAIAVLVGCAGPLETCSATVLYHSAIFRPTNPNEGIGGFTVASTAFVAKRFHLNSPAIINAIGGHFFAGQGTIFGAIVALSSAIDFPDSSTLSTPDVLAKTLFTTNEPREYTAPIGPISVPSGDYLIIVGSGLFGAEGSSGLVYSNTPIPGESGATISWTPSRDWNLVFDPLPTMLTVHGTVVPEPSSLAVCLCALAAATVWRMRR